VLDAIDAIPADPECPLLTGARQIELCHLHRRFALMTQKYIEFLKEITLEEVLRPGGFPAQCPGPEHLPEDTQAYPCTHFSNQNQMAVVSGV
jgi:hypothetical protein